MKQVSEECVRDALFNATKGRGGTRGFARQLDVSHSLISMIRSGSTVVTPRVAEALGYRVEGDRKHKTIQFFEVAE